jgi:penicillin-binding protein 1A
MLNKRKKKPSVKPEYKRLKVFNSLSDIEGPVGDFIRFLNFRKSEIRIALLGIMIGISIASVIIIVIDFQKVKSLSSFKPNVTTKIYDKNGILISELFSQKREVVSYKKMPKHLTQALIAIEDNEFYEHPGINVKGITRAFFVNILAGRIRQGGSTITQQLAKILLTSRKRNIIRKAKEAVIALMIEANYSKDEIMELYLNQIFLGHGTYGVQAASKYYFGKNVWDLSIAESAILASLPSAPNRFSPIRHPKRSMTRHKIVLAKMVEMGFITIPQAEEAYSQFWPEYLEHISHISPTMTTWSNRIDRAPWFTEFIRRKLIKKYGRETVYEKGLLVYTTLDVQKQEAGQKALFEALKKQTVKSSRLIFNNEDLFAKRFSQEVELLSYLFDLSSFTRTGSRQNEKISNYVRNNVVEELEGLSYIAGIAPVNSFIDRFKKSYSDDRELQQVEGAIITLNHQTGGIEAMIGGSHFSSINQLNRVVQMRRQPGSSIKPLLYASAFNNKSMTPATTLLDSPAVYLDHEGGEWLPENYEGEYYGMVRLRKALAMSINVISIRIAEKLGVDYVKNFYQRMLDIPHERIPRNYSIALGSVEVSPLELVRAYSIIANGGKDVIPYSIRYIKNREGKIIENREKEVAAILKKKAKDGTLYVIKPETAQLMVSMLRTVMSGGTGARARPGRPAGGKTGTTNNWKDAWFVGFTPRYATALWMGYDKLGLSLGIGQSAGVIAAPVWGEYMRNALKGTSVIPFPPYSKLIQQEVCSRTGLLPSPECQDKMMEYFIPGTVPVKMCEECKNIDFNHRLAKRGPRKNIVKEQKKSVTKKFRNDSTDDILGDINDDLLKKE